MCDGPGSRQSAAQKRKTAEALRAYWRSPEGQTRRIVMREANRFARLARLADRRTA